MFNSLPPQRLYSPWNSLDQNTGVGSLSLLQEIFPTQGLNSGLPHCRWIFFYQLSHKGSPRILEWVAYPFSSESSQPRDWTRVTSIAGGFFTNWAIREALHEVQTKQLSAHHDGNKGFHKWEWVCAWIRNESEDWPFCCSMEPWLNALEEWFRETWDKGHNTSIWGSSVSFESFRVAEKLVYFMKVYFMTFSFLLFSIPWIHSFSIFLPISCDSEELYFLFPFMLTIHPTLLYHIDYFRHTVHQWDYIFLQLRRSSVISHSNWAGGWSMIESQETIAGFLFLSFPPLESGCPSSTRLAVCIGDSGASPVAQW